MAIFNSYVSLPEGNHHAPFPNLPARHAWDGPRSLCRAAQKMPCAAVHFTRAPRHAGSVPLQKAWNDGSGPGLKYYNDLTATSLEIMVSKGNHPQMALIQVSEIL